jgi:hypothetical protein
MIELTQEQHRQLCVDPHTLVVDPQTRQRYVLVQAEVFEKLQDLLAVDDVGWTEAAYRSSMEVFAKDGWNDPAMDVYDALDPRRPS